MKRLASPWLVTGILVVILVAIVIMAIRGERREPSATVVSAGDFLVRVDARKPGWQPVGIAVGRGTTVRIVVTGGQWTHLRGLAAYNAGAGGDYVCADAIPASACIEPVADFPQGGLVGRIGGHSFPVGEAVTLSAPADGPIHLRINDADEGLRDNDGSLFVRVSVGP